MEKKLRILLFGILAEKLNATELNFPFEKDTDTLLSALKNSYPNIHETVFSLAVNKKIISQNTTLQQDDEVALLPPFSGG